MKRLGILLAVLVGLAILTWRLTRFGSEASPVAIETRERIATRGDAAVVPVPDAQAVLEERRAAEDGASATAPIAEAAPLALSVRDPLGAPVAGALVVLFRGETALGNARTDAAGNAVVPAPGGEGEYVLFADGWAFFRGAIDLSGGSRTLSLVEGATVAGRVLVDGAAPREPIELVWSTSPNVPTGLDWHELPLEIRRIVLGHRNRGSEITAHTSMGGGFAFRGLVADVQGSLRWSGPYVPEGLPAASFGPGARQRDVAAPSSDLVLRLEMALEVRMRFVSPTGEPIAGAYANLESGATQAPRGVLMGDALGRASLLLPRDAPGPLRLTGGRTNVAPTQTFVAHRPQDSGLIWDLGDLVLPTTRRITVHVCDSEGVPIYEARAGPWRPSAQDLGSRTTMRGSVALEVPEGPSRVRVQSFGFLGALVDVPADAVEVTASLARACRLVFHLPEGIWGAGGRELELECDGPMFVDAPECPGLHMRTPGAALSIERSGDKTRATLDLSAGRQWSIAALAPATPLRARVRLHSRLLCETTIAALAPGEHRDVEIPPFEQLRSDMTVRVLRSSGSALPNAELLQVWSDARWWCAPERLGRTNVEGECRVRLDEPHGMLLIRHELCVPRLVPLESIPAEPLVVRMEDARGVEVEVVRPDGTPCDEASAVTHESPLSGFRAGESLGGGRFRLTGLAPGAAKFTVHLPMGEIQSVHDTANDFVRIVVGGRGSILCHVKHSEPRITPSWAVVLARSGASENLHRLVLDGRDRDEWAQFDNLPDGEYTLRIEVRITDAPYEHWGPVFRPTIARIDAEHPAPQVELTIE